MATLRTSLLVALVLILAVAGIAGGWFGASVFAQHEEIYCSVGKKMADGHPCHCPAMVHRVHYAIVEKCEMEHSYPKEDYLKCIQAMPDACEITQHPAQFGESSDEDSRALLWMVSPVELHL